MKPSLSQNLKASRKDGWGVGSITLFPHNSQIIKVTSGIGFSPEPYFSGFRESRVLQLQLLPAVVKALVSRFRIILYFLCVANAAFKPLAILVVEPTPQK